MVLESEGGAWHYSRFDANGVAGSWAILSTNNHGDSKYQMGFTDGHIGNHKINYRKRIANNQRDEIDFTNAN